MYASFGTECAALDNRRNFTIIGNGVLVERRLRKVPVNCSKIFEAKFIGAVSAITQTSFLHGKLRHPELCRRRIARGWSQY